MALCWTYGKLRAAYYYIWGQTHTRLSATQVNVTVSYSRSTVLNFSSEKAMDLLDSPADSSKVIIADHHYETKSATA